MSHAAPVPTPPPPSPHLSNLKLSSMHVGLARRREPGTTLSHLYTVQTCELHKREHNSLHRDYTWIHNLWWITGQECDLPGSSLDSTSPVPAQQAAQAHTSNIFSPNKAVLAPARSKWFGMWCGIKHSVSFNAHVSLNPQLETQFIDGGVKSDP